ncbi:hypothetical protein P280DRAFT_248786 [Massarina eburnea CBS 473.64]|uniref:Uncharacterized protein n=1 Tax=Massarina eburnea CBS 473.64 TaxID=1395130 RepID=A0A6A6S8H7_9PLEO|nr:hypothetical protein P280DRAFT_248786 [Massarina eburnea CBS 473.64]
MPAKDSEALSTLLSSSPCLLPTTSAYHLCLPPLCDSYWPLRLQLSLRLSASLQWLRMSSLQKPRTHSVSLANEHFRSGDSEPETHHSGPAPLLPRGKLETLWETRAFALLHRFAQFSPDAEPLQHIMTASFLLCPFYQPSAPPAEDLPPFWSAL